MTLMVALVGDQTMPNLLPVRRYHPDRVLLVYTPRTKPKYDLLRATLQRETKVDGIETDAYNIPTIAQAIRAKLDSAELASEPTEFNLTGGTKAMSFAAYEVAQQRNAPVLYLESEGKRNRIYQYIWANQQLQGTSSELIPECVDLKDLFDVHLGIGQWTEEGPTEGDGGRFERALAQTLQTQGYEVMTGIKTMEGQIDIDVAMRWENRFGIIEAKTGNSGRTLNGIKQLSIAGPRLGIFTQAFYVINVERNTVHDAIADASRIQVISLNHYVTGSDSLPTNDEDIFVATIGSTLKAQ
jgi:hypothetical protein